MFTLSAVIMAPKKTKQEISDLTETDEFQQLRKTVEDFIIKNDLEAVGFEFKESDLITTSMYDSYGRKVT